MNKDIPAFPSPDFGHGVRTIGGMTLRDYFAGQALAGLCSTLNFGSAPSDERLAQWSYDLADAMLEARGEGGLE